MFRLVPYILVFSLPLALIAAEPTADERKAAISTLTKEAERRAKLAQIEKDWAAQLAKKKDAALAEKLGNLRSEMKGWKNTKAEDFAEPLVLSRAGEVGTLPHQKVRVGAVIDKNTATIVTRTNRTGAEPDDDITLIVHGVDTSTWADDLAIDAPPGVWIVTQEKRGGRTLFALYPLALTKDESAAVLKAAKP